MTKKDNMMPSANSVANGSTLVTVAALMEERKRFESWIDALDARRSSTPEHVFGRVHTDYVSRLDAVVAQLNSHTDALRREMDVLSTRMATIRGEQQRIADARAEAELRAHVGELSDSDWTTSAAQSDSQLTELAAQYDAAEQELARIRDLLEGAARPSGVFAAFVVPDNATATAPAPREREKDTAPAFVESSIAEMSSAPAVESVTEEPMMELPPAVIAAEQQLLDLEERNAPAPEAPKKPSGQFDEIAFVSSVVDTPPGTFDPGPADQPTERTRRDTFARRAHEDSIINLADNGSPLAEPKVEMESRPPLMGTPPDGIPVRNTASEGAKSLKCGECGALNYPTEWYCERCGAELASL